MRRMLAKKSIIIVILALVMTLAACSESKKTSEADLNQGQGLPEIREINIGCMATCEPLIEWVAEALKPMGYNMKTIMYDGNQLPATACKDGDIDGLIHNHLPWIEVFNKENNCNLKMPHLLAYGRTAMYSSSHEILAEIPQNATIALAGDPTNLERGLEILRDLGFITLGEKIGKFYSLLDIVDNPKNIKILETEISATIRSITDVDAVIAPALRAKLAGLDPNVFLYEDPSSRNFPFGFVVDAKNVNEEWLLETIKYTQTAEFRKKFDDHYGGAYVLFDPEGED